MEIIKNAAEAISSVKNKRPLIHQITNYVTANDCANVTLAIGALPIMADAVIEIEEITMHADALVLNLGTPNELKLKAMLAAGRVANSRNIPVILDPVGVGATQFRKNAAIKILNELKIQIIRGNLSEIMAINGMDETTIGVDTKERAGDSEERNNYVRDLVLEAALKSGTVVAATGEKDFISDGKSCYMINNGNPMMSRVTGMGCMCSALIGAYAGAINDDFIATIAGVLTSGIAGEAAFGKINLQHEGTGSFKARFIDEIFLMHDLKLIENASMIVVQK